MIDGRAKGRAFEREMALMFDGKRTPLSGAAGGWDLTPRAGTIWADWSWELKRRATLPASITSPLDQAEGDIALGDRRKPAVLMREDNGRAVFICYAADLKLWAEALAETGQGSKLRALAKEIEGVATELRRMA